MNYVVNDKSSQQKMLEDLGLKKLDDLYRDIPQGARYEKELQITEGKSESEVLKELKELADKNVTYSSIFRGAGSYAHLIPSVVKSLSSLPGYVTSYTPYQAEISQGWLQAMFEYQTLICDLTGMEVANATDYDGGTAAAESLRMVIDQKRTTILVSGSINPETYEVLKTYSFGEDLTLKEIPLNEGKIDISKLTSLIDEKVAGVYLEQPNYYGLLEEVEAISEIVHQHKIKLIVGAEPISLGILKSPRELGADIAVGELQPLGIELSFGGPYGGYMATTKELMRKLPGRIVGQTQDRHGNTSYVLTLQAREQHIRREKASSSICSNEAICALKAAIYLAAVGKQGLKDIAQRCLTLAHYTADRIQNIAGYKLKYSGEYFAEFVIETRVEVSKINEALKEKKILGPLELNEHEMLVCVTEANREEDIDTLIEVLTEVSR